MRKPLLVILLFLIFAGCQPDQSIVVNPTQTVTITSPIGPGVTGSPTPSATPSARFSVVRVGIFAQTCPGGGGVPDNAQNTIRVGCVAALTVTPKDANGHDLQLPDAVWMQMKVSWTITGPSCTDLNSTMPNINPFNREVRGEIPGTCVICANVDGVQGCAIQPNGERVVRVII